MYEVPRGLSTLEPPRWMTSHPLPGHVRLPRWASSALQTVGYQYWTGRMAPLPDSPPFPARYARAERSVSGQGVALAASVWLTFALFHAEPGALRANVSNL